MWKKCFGVGNVESALVGIAAENIYITFFAVDLFLVRRLQVFIKFVIKAFDRMLKAVDFKLSFSNLINGAGAFHIYPPIRVKIGRDSKGRVIERKKNAD